MVYQDSGDYHHRVGDCMRSSQHHVPLATFEPLDGCDATQFLVAPHTDAYLVREQIGDGQGGGEDYLGLRTNHTIPTMTVIPTAATASGGIRDRKGELEVVEVFEVVEVLGVLEVLGVELGVVEVLEMGVVEWKAPYTST